MRTPAQIAEGKIPRAGEEHGALVVTLFALSNLWIVRKQRMAMAGAVRPKTA